MRGFPEEGIKASRHQGIEASRHRGIKERQEVEKQGERKNKRMGLIFCLPPVPPRFRRNDEGWLRKRWWVVWKEKQGD